MNFLTAIFGAIREFFGFARERQSLKNAADMKAAKTSQNQVNAQNKIETDVAKKDTSAIRDDLAE